MAKAKRIQVRTLDFSNVKESSGINPKHKEDGEYLGRVVEIRDDDAKDGEAMWNFIFSLEDDKTATYPYYVKLVDNQLWKLRNLFIAAGIPVPKKAMKVDPNKVVGVDLGIILEGEEYEGKMKSVVSGLIPKEELTEFGGSVADDDEDDEDDEAPAPKKRGRPAKKAAVVEDDDDDDEDEDEEPAPKKRGRGRPKKVVEPEEDDDDEDEEEEPAPKKRGRGRPKKVVVEDDDDDEDEEEEPAPKKKRGRPAKAAAAPAKKKRRRVEDDDDLDIDL